MAFAAGLAIGAGLIVESQALNVPPRPAISASNWHSAFAPAMPPRLPSNTLELTKTVFGLNIFALQ